MDNSSYRSQYILKNTANMIESSAVSVRDFWNRVSAIERQIGKPIESGYSKDDYITLFTNLHLRNRSILHTAKGRVSGYVKYLYDCGVVSEDNLLACRSVSFNDIPANVVFDDGYFKDFQSLKDNIDTTIHIADRCDDHVFDTQVVALYLAWCGVSADEAVQILKEDVHDDYIQVGSRKVRPNKTIIERILEYRDAEGYRSWASCIIFLKYKSSPFLLRTKSDSQMDSKTLRSRIRAFNQIKKEPEAADQLMNLPSSESCLLRYDRVYWSGIFHRAYLYELANGEIVRSNIDLLSELFNESYSNFKSAYSRFQEYTRYRDYFFPSEE